MTQAATTPSSAGEIVVDAPIERAFARVHRAVRRLQAPRAQPARRRRSPRPSSSRASAATSTTAPRTAASAAGPASSPTSRRTGSCSAGTSAHWQLETDPDHTSEVEVRFIAETPERTRVELEHRNIDRHGPGWEAVRDGVDGEAGWPLTCSAMRRCSCETPDARLTGSCRSDIAMIGSSDRGEGKRLPLNPAPMKRRRRSVNPFQPVARVQLESLPA